MRSEPIPARVLQLPFHLQADCHRSGPAIPLTPACISQLAPIAARHVLYLHVLYLIVIILLRRSDPTFYARGATPMFHPEPAAPRALRWSSQTSEL